jgi:hypothetical protein
MSAITINIDLLAGTEISQAVTEAKNKAKAWDVAYVCFKFNGVDFSIGQNADIERVLDEWKNHDDKRYGIVAS